MKPIQSFCPPHFKLPIVKCQGKQRHIVTTHIRLGVTAAGSTFIQPPLGWSLLTRSEAPLFAALGESLSDAAGVCQPAAPRRRANGKTRCRRWERQIGWHDVGLRPLHCHASEQPIRERLWSHPRRTPACACVQWNQATAVFPVGPPGRG